ncbi:DUF1488 family protein [Novosphingobium sp. CECT 9465]|uniref:DUF1488 family protein n=1 Tax=Novosphingobium sp. CECT 9465 TaxID=2829794 RepID=UPI001E30891D|nr:DUF1488 family protein [Novosphingobium sp. CECT 9465]CAH0496838.1 hypothetical protein NVSP9465_01886 [Novosphingobium sp. CECT 9465]
MKVRILGPGEYDRHEEEVRFFATVGRTQTSVTVTAHALFIVSQAMGFSTSDPLVAYAAGGKLLELVVASLIEENVEIQPTYMVTYRDVLRFTGVEPSLPHVPKPWKPL